MVNGSGVSRGDRNRNARLDRLRALVRSATRSSESIWPYRDTHSYYEQALGHYGNLARTEHPEQQLTRLQSDIDATAREFTAARARITGPLGEPTLRALPAGRLSAERDQWHVDRDHRTREQSAHSAQRDADLSTDRLTSSRAHEHDVAPSLDHGPGISR